MDKVLSYITLCKKAGKLSLGYENTRHEIFKGNVHLVLLCSDLSEKSKQGFIRFCDSEGIEVKNIDNTLDEMEFYIGKKSGIIGIKDAGFARAILNNISL